MALDRVLFGTGNQDQRQNLLQEIPGLSFDEPALDHFTSCCFRGQCLKDIKKSGLHNGQMVISAEGRNLITPQYKKKISRHFASRNDMKGIMQSSHKI